MCRKATLPPTVNGETDRGSPDGPDELFLFSASVREGN